MKLDARLLPSIEPRSRLESHSSAVLGHGSVDTKLDLVSSKSRTLVSVDDFTSWHLGPLLLTSARDRSLSIVSPVALVGVEEWAKAVRRGSLGYMVRGCLPAPERTQDR